MPKVVTIGKNLEFENLPLVLAIADFHKAAAPGEAGSMTYSQGGAILVPLRHPS